jgi:transcriptional regulator with XRE-family HTH domain
MNYKILRDIRKMRQISLQEMSKMTSISRNTLSDIENGKCNPTINRVETICKVLDVELKIVM